MADPLPRRQLGRTGLWVSVLGFGASPLGGVFEEIDEGRAIQAVHDAFAAGINFFDTAPFYGDTKSETVLGRGLKDLPRSEFVLSTKVGRYGQTNFDFSAERVTRSVSESLQRLQVPYIDVIQVHDIEFGDLDLVVKETVPALLRLKEQGLVRHVGISGLPLPCFKYVLDRVEPGSVEVVLSYCQYSLNNTALTNLMPYLEAKNVGLVSASPLSMGLLTQQGPPVWHPAGPEIKAACAAAAKHAQSRGVDIAKLAMAHGVRHPSIATTLVGMATPEIVATNVQAVKDALSAEPSALEAEVLEEVRALLAPFQGKTWPSGREENQSLQL